jgi:hypothetical protein
MIEIIISVIALFIAIFLPLFIERLKRPELEIHPQEEKPKKDSDHWYYHMEVFNKKRRFMGGFIQRDVAKLCEARIEFLNKESRKPIIHQITAKWAQQLNPVTPQVIGNRIIQVFDETKVPSCQVIDVGFEKRTFDVVIKFRGEKECYAFDPWIHFINWKDPRLKLDVNECIIRIELRAANLTQPKIAEFILLNKGTELKDLKIA